jgi:hypothetical protein
MSLTLGLITLPNPNEFATTPEVKGEYTQTLDGTRRRAIQAVKNIYVLGYSRLTTDEYDEIKTEFDLHTPRDLVWSELGINTSVHIDLSDRVFTPGNPNFISDVTITLREV